MPDLHGWLTQQIDDVESVARLVSAGGYEPDEWRIEPSRSGRWTQIVVYSRTLGEPPEAASREEPVAFVQTGRNEHLMMAMHDPARVLRRCEADRRVLARHRLDPDAYWADAAMCEGCGTEGEMDYPRTENLNDCPELLDLAHAHGLTDEILAGLDRPQAGERPEPGPGFRLPDAIIGAYTRALTEMTLNARPLEPRLHVKVVGIPMEIPDWLREDLGLPDPVPEPTPGERALSVLEPHLGAIALYQPTEEATDA